MVQVGYRIEKARLRSLLFAADLSAVDIAIRPQRSRRLAKFIMAPLAAAIVHAAAHKALTAKLL